MVDRHLAGSRVDSHDVTLSVVGRGAAAAPERAEQRGETYGAPHRGHRVAKAKKSPFCSVPSSANVLRARFTASDAKPKPSSAPEKVPRARVWRKNSPAKAGAPALR